MAELIRLTLVDDHEAGYERRVEGMRGHDVGELACKVICASCGQSASAFLPAFDTYCEHSWKEL